MENTYTIQDVANIICDNVKTKRWLSGTLAVKTEKGVFNIGIKAFGKWVQILQYQNIKYDVTEQKTIKSLNLEVVKTLSSLLERV